MGRRRWRHDGPVMSAQGWTSINWVAFQTIARMSDAAGKARTETAKLWQFFEDHPEHIPTRSELESTPPEKLIADAFYQMRLFEAEKKRREAVRLRAARQRYIETVLKGRRYGYE
jgi:hypothetical protein